GLYFNAQLHPGLPRLRTSLAYRHIVEPRWTALGAADGRLAGGAGTHRRRQRTLYRPQQSSWLFDSLPRRKSRTRPYAARSPAGPDRHAARRCRMGRPVGAGVPEGAGQSGALPRGAVLMANQPPPSFSLGIEEEYLLVDRDTRDLVPDPPPTMLEECQQRLEGRVSPEFLRCQIEVGTRVCSSLAEARADLADLRATVAEVAGRHALAPIAAATHPFASWTAQKPTERERYLTLARDMQAPARRLIICGLHVHVGLEDPQRRIDLVGQVAYFLPHLLALSTSSPFWRGNDTGLKSYRIAVFNEMPRTGLPESFDSFAEYERHLAVLVKAGLIEDGTKLWWDCRPSARFPTLE